MKLIFAEYLASLKERGELDVIMPDLLSEIGLTVLSRPAVGTRQHGVDVAAVGTLDGKLRKLYLLSIKPGVLTRADWDDGTQSLRSSLNQIQDTYVATQVLQQHKDLPIVIVLCLGGEMHESVRPDVKGYMDNHKTDSLSFEVWSADSLASRLLTGVLRENALPKDGRSDFRKAVALVDEPRESFEYFCSFGNQIADACLATKKARLTAIRQIYIGLWTLYVWGREAKNIEGAYLSSEFALLASWSLIRESFEGNSKVVRAIRQSVQRLISLHWIISEDYINTYVVPHAGVVHGLSAAVPSGYPLDVNLRLFELVGRIGLRGLWLVDQFLALDKHKDEKLAAELAASIGATANLLLDMIRNNPALRTPIKDNQAIDINIACLFLDRADRDDGIRYWVKQIAQGTIFAFRANLQYPCIYNDYRELIQHPSRTDEYRREATCASVLVPTLAVWAALCSDEPTLALLVDFAAGPFSHSTLQLWFPGTDSEAHLYRGDASHGLAYHDIRITPSCKQVLSPIKSECDAADAFLQLSAVARGLWPLVILASRHHRIPVPPHFWRFPEADVT